MADTTHLKTRTLGLILVSAATVSWSTAGLFVRAVDLDAWAVLGWRSIFAALALGAIVLVNGRKQLAADGSEPPAIATWLTVPVAVISMGAYVVSLKLTTVANVMIVYASVPLVAALLAWFVLRERLSLAMFLASLVALAGVFILANGVTAGQDYAGLAVAFMMTLAMALQIVMARKYPGMPMAKVNMLAASVWAVLGLALTPSGLPAVHDILVLMAFGVTNTALAYYFILRGARLIPAAEVGLISTLDVVLGPLWVWLVFGENPGVKSLIGGTLVLIAVLGYLLAQKRRR